MSVGGPEAGCCALSTLLFKRDFAPDREGVGGGAPAVAMGVGCSLQSLDEEVLPTGRPETWVSCCPRSVEALPGAFEFGGVESRRAVEDGLLAGVEVDELLAVEVVEVADVEAVGLLR